MLSNNLANSGTSAYKGDREFYSLFVSSESGADPADPLAEKLPVIERQWTDFSQGILQPTGNSSDLALSGKGFFTVAGPSGPLYTRNGAYRVTSKGALVNSEGYSFLDKKGKPIKVAADLPVEVLSDGSVRQAGDPAAQLMLVDFPDPSALAKQGNTYFRNIDPAKAPPPATGVEVQQGKIENSNVATAESAVRLVGIMRQFEALQKAVGISTNMNKKAIEEVAKVAT